MSPRRQVTKFRDLGIGDSFDFINDSTGTPRATFWKRCVKVSQRTYVDQDGSRHTVGSVSAEVFHVQRIGEAAPAGTPQAGEVELSKRCGDTNYRIKKVYNDQWLLLANGTPLGAPTTYALAVQGFHAVTEGCS